MVPSVVNIMNERFGCKASHSTEPDKENDVVRHRGVMYECRDVAHTTNLQPLI